MAVPSRSGFQPNLPAAEQHPQACSVNLSHRAAARPAVPAMRALQGTPAGKVSPAGAFLGSPGASRRWRGPDCRRGLAPAELLSAPRTRAYRLGCSVGTAAPGRYWASGEQATSGCRQGAKVGKAQWQRAPVGLWANKVRDRHRASYYASVQRWVQGKTRPRTTIGVARHSPAKLPTVNYSVEPRSQTEAKRTGAVLGVFVGQWDRVQFVCRHPGC